jgi:hypothetical protein
VVRLCLGPLNAPQRAYAIVRKTRSADAAHALAKHCLTAQDFKVSIHTHDGTVYGLAPYAQPANLP